MLIEPKVQVRNGMSFDGVVGEFGSLPQKNETIFTIEKEFNGNPDEMKESIHKRLIECQILEENVEKKKMGGYIYTARIKYLGAGIPDLNQRAFNVKTFEDTIGYFEGIKLYQIKTNEDGTEKYTFIKCILGEVKMSSIIPEICFTQDKWDKVYYDFIAQENMIRARMARKGLNEQAKTQTKILI